MKEYSQEKQEKTNLSRAKGQGKDFLNDGLNTGLSHLKRPKYKTSLQDKRNQNKKKYICISSES